MDLQLTIAEDVRDLAVGVVIVSGARIEESEAELREHCDATVRRVLAAGADGGDARRAAVRQLLRYGGFKPSGRNKPAQEYLLRVATQEGRLSAWTGLAVFAAWVLASLAAAAVVLRRRDA